MVAQQCYRSWFLLGCY